MGSRTRPGSQQFQVLVAAGLTDLVLIQVAAASSADAHRLTLHDLAPRTIWMLQGPVERIGHLSTGTFLDLWWDVGGGLSDSSLPAVLGRADAEGQCLPDPRFLLRSPRISGSGVQYDIEWLSGSAPSHTGACVLILGSGRPSAHEQTSPEGHLIRVVRMCPPLGRTVVRRPMCWPRAHEPEEVLSCAPCSRA